MMNGSSTAEVDPIDIFNHECAVRKKKKTLWQALWKRMHGWVSRKEHLFQLPESFFEQEGVGGG